MGALNTISLRSTFRLRKEVVFFYGTFYKADSF